MAEQPAIELLSEPVVAVDGTVFRFKRLEVVDCDACAWQTLCASNAARGLPPPCEVWIEQELTWDWPKARKGERY